MFSRWVQSSCPHDGSKYRRFLSFDALAINDTGSRRSSTPLRFPRIYEQVDPRPLDNRPPFLERTLHICEWREILGQHPAFSDRRGEVEDRVRNLSQSYHRTGRAFRAEPLLAQRTSP